MDAEIQVGRRVYLANCIAGEPGVVREIDRFGKASVEWPDMPEVGITHHKIDALVLDQSFHVEHLCSEPKEVAA